MADNLTIILREVLLSYPHLQTAQPPQNAGEKAKFGATVVIMPDQEENLRLAKAAIKEAAEARFGPKAAELFQAGKLKFPLKAAPADKGYPAGSFTIGARNENRPGMVFPWPDPETKKAARVPEDKIREVFYPGAVVNVQIRAFTYDKPTNKGVSFGLHNIQFVRDGERLDGRGAADDVFEADLSQAPAGLEDLL